MSYPGTYRVNIPLEQLFFCVFDNQSNVTLQKCNENESKTDV